MSVKGDTWKADNSENKPVIGLIGMTPWHHMKSLCLYRIDHKMEEFNNILIVFQAIEVKKNLI